MYRTHTFKINYKQSKSSASVVLYLKETKFEKYIQHKEFVAL
jgi:hypothetical protein